MPHRRLKPAPPLAGQIGPFEVKLERLQEHFQPKRYARRPIDCAFLNHFADQLKLIFRQVEIDCDLVTSDGRHWIAVSFLYINDLRFTVLFPHQEHRVATGHVSLFCQCEEEPEQKVVGDIAKTITQLFEMDLSEFYWKSSRR